MSFKKSLDTPALCIDLDAMDANIALMAGFILERGKQWRPHQKCHKTPQIAQRQIEAGAIGVTCAKVSEAEVMAAGGVRDILIANMIVGEQKLERVAALCGSADPIVTCDHYSQAEALATVCLRRGIECRVIIEVDIGLNRVGVRPGSDSLRLAQGIDGLNGVRLVGIMGYEGHLLRIADPEDKRREINDAMTVLAHCRDLMLRDGINCDIVSAGGTGSYQMTSDCEAVTELQAGGGIFGDVFYEAQCGVTGHAHALTVLTTVCSRPSLEKAVLDAGRKSQYPDLEKPIVKDWPDARVGHTSAEHCQVELGADAQRLAIGDKVELIVGYSDFTTVMHDNFHAFRGDQLEVVWPIAGRGKMT